MRDGIMGSMQASATPWTHGDLDAFMRDYLDSVIARGPTTVVMIRTSAGWKIVHDHSS